MSKKDEAMIKSSAAKDAFMSLISENLAINKDKGKTSNMQHVKSNMVSAHCAFCVLHFAKDPEVF